MNIVLQQKLPDDMHAARGLPGAAPVQGPWLHVDEAYAGQMALRCQLLSDRRLDVLAELPGSGPAVEELREMVFAELPALGFTRRGQGWLCPDGRIVPDGTGLETLGRLCQADFCVLQKPDGADEHVMTAAVLCFPASWRLGEKIGHPLRAIHAPVAEYDDALARRVQRLFDGVQPGRALWRFNRLWYQDAALFQPRSETEPRPVGSGRAPYLRSERQVVMRLPKTQAAVFVIHTYVVAAADVPALR